MFAELIESETPELDEEGVRMRFIGRREGISDDLLRHMAWAEEVTAGNERMTLFVAFNYGGRAEIVDAAERYEGGGEEAFGELLYAPEMTDPELDRKSTRLNSSHLVISYAVFCLKKKKTNSLVA